MKKYSKYTHVIQPPPLLIAGIKPMTSQLLTGHAQSHH